MFHSPLGAAAGRSWYGSQDVIDRWVHEIWRDADELAGEDGSWLETVHSSWQAASSVDCWVHDIWRGADELAGVGAAPIGAT